MVGSNNWAVSPSKTANGHAILAGDPHLGMSLPSVWYEVHTVVRDSLDVYGVTLPGAAGAATGLRDAALVLLAADAFGGAERCVEMAVDYEEEPPSPGAHA